MLRLAVLALAAAAAVASAAELDPKWVKGLPAAPAQEHTAVLFAPLVPGAAASCDSELEAVSTPGSPRYGHHVTSVTSPAFGARFGGDPRHAAPLRAWAEAAPGLRISAAAPHGEWLEVSGPVAAFERALPGVRFHHFALVGAERGARHTSIVAAEGDLPKHLAQHVEIHMGLTSLPLVTAGAALERTLQLRRSTGAASGIATPQVIWQAYGVTGNKIASTKSSNGLFGALGQSFSQQDLADFQNKYNIPNTKISQVVGPNSPAACASNPNNCVEASLDVQQITSMAQGTNTTFWSIPSSVNDIFLSFIQAVSATDDVPKVFSISYGGVAKEEPKYDMTRFNTEVCKMGLRGMTVFVASGDDGVANFPARSNPGACGFSPSYPATCPYVTAVGATQGPESGEPEVACCSNTGGGITSGGGFSATFSTPNYQQKAVNAYLAKGAAVDLPPKNMFASGGRGYPDVAAMGHNYPIELSGNTYEGSGTSASSPVFAGVITLINGLRIQAGKPTLGFLNPAIYGTLLGTSALNDITVGRNNCAAGGQVCCQYGFNATTGWDPITGAGSPNYPALSKALVAL